jgi:hypothetical protein
MNFLLFIGLIVSLLLNLILLVEILALKKKAANLTFSEIQEIGSISKGTDKNLKKSKAFPFKEIPNQLIIKDQKDLENLKENFLEDLV